MKNLYIMVSPPGCGKSTFIKNHLNRFSGSPMVVSRDDIRFRLVSEGDEYFSKEKNVYKTFIKDIKEGLDYTGTVIADATHLNRGSRTKLLRTLGQSLKDTKVSAIVIDTCLATALKQNELRAGTRSYVPPTEIKKMFGRFEMPQLEEGFSQIIIYNKNEEYQFKIKVAEE